VAANGSCTCGAGHPCRPLLAEAASRASVLASTLQVMAESERPPDKKEKSATLSAPHEKPPHAMLFEMLFGAWTAKVLAEIVRLDVPDALVQGPLTADELVRKAGIRAHPGALHRALRACASLGVVTEDSVGRFGPTRLSALLTRDAPGTLKRFVEYSGGTLWKIWTGLPEGLATGAPQARAQLGMDFFDYLAAHPKALDEFGETLKAHSAVANVGVMERYDFSGIRTLVDVGAGYGPLTLAVLEKYPQMRGVVFDVPEVIEAAPMSLPVKNESVAKRLRYAAGDMFREVPPADAYGAKILANVCSRLEKGGRVISIDNVMPPLGDVSDVPQKLLDVNMMLLLPGKERTRVEWEALYRGAGLSITAMIPVPDAFNMFIIEGRPAAER
jgi:hypothetical protein